MRATLFVSVALLSFAATAPTQDLYVFGDSLSYDGRLYAVLGTPNAPYVGGRFSDGLVYSEQLATATGRTLYNYAFPGATTTDVLGTQVLPFVAAHQGNVPGDGLYAYWAGGNDLLDLLAVPNGNAQFVIENAMTQTANALATLILSGAQDVVVLNLPDLSKTPRIIALNDPATTAAVAALAVAYNQALDYTVGQLEMMLPVDITVIDIFGLTTDITANPARYNLRIVDTPRLRENGTTWPRRWRFLFFDDIHPTFGGHRAMMWSVMQAVGLTIPGDVNGDFVVNRRDLWRMWSIFGPCSVGCAADLNRDGYVNWCDRWLLISMLAKH